MTLVCRVRDTQSTCEHESVHSLLRGMGTQSHMHSYNLAAKQRNTETFIFKGSLCFLLFSPHFLSQSSTHFAAPPPHPFICVSQIASLSTMYPILTRFSSTKLWGNTRWLCPKPHNTRGGPSKSTATLPVKNLILLVLTKRHSMAAAILLEAQLNGVSRSA